MASNTLQKYSRSNSLKRNIMIEDIIIKIVQIPFIILIYMMVYVPLLTLIFGILKCVALIYKLIMKRT